MELKTEKISIEKLIFCFPKYNTNPEFIETYKQSSAYQKLLKSVKKKGFINPLLVVKKNNKYMVWIGNQRLVIAQKLGYKKMNCIILPNSEKKTLLKYRSRYV